MGLNCAPNGVREFWAKPGQWPHDPKGYVFLARALDELGRARFGQEWTGIEFTLEVPSVLVDEQLPGNVELRSYAKQLLKTHLPAIAIESDRTDRAACTITQAQWTVARQISRKQFAAVAPALNRRTAVETAFVERCEANELVTACRPIEGGKMCVIPPEWWNTERSHSRFQQCQLNPGEPFSLEFSGESFAWIFVTRESLDAYVAVQPFDQKPIRIDGYLSPYLKHMIGVSKALQISPDHQPKKEVVATELQNAWRGQQPLSQNLIEAMATLVRDPESQLGRARRK